MTEPGQGTRLHFIGSPAEGVQEMAALGRAERDEVTTSDGHDPARITDEIGLVVMADGAHATPEAARAEELGLARTSFGAFVAERLRGARALVVAGDGGGEASMVAAMSAWILERAGLEPGFLVRRRATSLEASARLASRRRKILGGEAKAPPFVVDATCVWPSGLTEAESATPEVAVVTGRLDEHRLTMLAKRVRETGLVVCDARDASGCAIVERAARSGLTTYAIDTDPTGHGSPIWLAAMVRADADSGAQPFDLFASGSSCGRFALRGRGPDDVRLAVAAIAACAQGFAVDLEKVRAAVATFEGLR